MDETNKAICLLTSIRRSVMFWLKDNFHRLTNRSEGELVGETTETRFLKIWSKLIKTIPIVLYLRDIEMLMFKTSKTHGTLYLWNTSYFSVWMHSIIKHSNYEWSLQERLISCKKPKEQHWRTGSQKNYISDILKKSAKAFLFGGYFSLHNFPWPPKV